LNTEAIGRFVRAQRRRQGLRQAELAALAGVGNRFVSELEHGKPGLELGRVLMVLQALGAELEARARTWRDLESADGE